MKPRDRHGVTARLARYDALLEVGVGRRPEVAAGLADAGCRVVAVDVHPREVPDGVDFRVDDVVDAAGRDRLPAAYRVDAVYGLNRPAELQRPARELAERVGADCLFTTLGAEQPVVPVARRRVGRETLYAARSPPGE